MTNSKINTLNEFNYSKPFIPPAENPAFRAWFNGSKVVDGAGQPLVVYHGTTHNFDVFDDAQGNNENYYGRGHYFTSSRDDTKNYAGVGPDLTNRIERDAENLVSEWEYSGEEQYEDKSWDDLYHLAKEEVSKRLKGPHGGIVMPCYLRIVKPVVVAKSGGTYFDFDYNCRTGAITGKLARTVSQLFPDLWNEIVDECYDGISAYDFEKYARGSDAMMDEFLMESGGPGPAIAKIYRAMGFDGIIMIDVASAFKNMAGVDNNTRHYIIWSTKQVKSAIGNSGRYSKRKPSIVERREQKAKLLATTKYPPKVTFRPGGFDVSCFNGNDRVGFLQIDYRSEEGAES